MELHNAIRGILKMQGSDFVLDPRFLNALDDFNAFEQNNAFKNVLRIILADGYAGKMIKIGAWNSKVQSFIDDLVYRYSFDRAVTAYIIESLAFGLGYSSDEPFFIASQPSSNVHNTFQHNRDYLDKKQSEYRSMTDDERNQFIADVREYLDSIVEVKGNWEKDLGAKFKINSEFHIYGSGNNPIYYNIEVDGNITLQEYSWINFIGAFYDDKGRILGNVKASHFKKVPKSFEVLHTGSIDCNEYLSVANISKVVFYWDIV